MSHLRKCNGCNVTTYNPNKDFTCAKCGFKYFASANITPRDKVIMNRKDRDNLKYLLQKKVNQERKKK